MPTVATHTLSPEEPEKHGSVLCMSQGQAALCIQSGCPHTLSYEGQCGPLCTATLLSVQPRRGRRGHSQPGTQHVDTAGPYKWVQSPRVLGGLVVSLPRLRATDTSRQEPREEGLNVGLRLGGPETWAQTEPGPRKPRRCAIPAGGPLPGPASTWDWATFALKTPTHPSGPRPSVTSFPKLS